MRTRSEKLFGFVCSENVVYSTPEHEKAFAFRNPCVFKIGATGAKRTYGKEYVPVLPEPGILMERNTVLWGAGCLFWAAVWGNNPDKVTLKDNIIYTEMNMPVGWQGRFDFLRLDGNIVVQRAVNGLEDQTVNAQPVISGTAELNPVFCAYKEWCTPGIFFVTALRQDLHQDLEELTMARIANEGGFVYEFAWSDPVCAKVEPPFTYAWSDPVCAKTKE